MYKNRHNTKSTNAAPKNNYIRITLTLCPTGSRMFPLCPPTTRSSPATHCALCHSRGLQSWYWNWHQRVVGVISRNQQSPSKNSQYQSIRHVDWHSTRHFSVNAKNCIQTQTQTNQSAINAKLLYCMFADCPLVTQIIQMLQPTVMITYLPPNSNKVCSPPSLERTTVDNDTHKDVFTDIRQATGLKHPDMYTDWTVDTPNNVFNHPCEAVCMKHLWHSNATAHWEPCCGILQSPTVY
jgi:hypothetical protein